MTDAAFVRIGGPRMLEGPSGQVDEGWWPGAGEPRRGPSRGCTLDAQAQLPPPCKGVPNIVEQRIIGRSSTAIGWLSVPAGAYLLEWEQAQFDREVADVFGYYALQIGLGELDCLRANRMPCRVFAGVPSSGPSEAAAVARPQATPPADEASRDASRSPAVIVHIAQPEELPFETQSLDLVALPHVLESTADPHQVLREVDRVLRPEGRLIVSGLNPVSLWGARHLLPGGLPPDYRRATAA